MIYVIIIILVVIISLICFNKNDNKEDFTLSEFPDNGINYSISPNPWGYTGLVESKTDNSGATHGIIPPFGVCNKVIQSIGKQDYPYSTVKDEYETVSNYPVGTWENRDNLGGVINGEGWSAGRTRQCRRLWNGL